MNDNEPPQSDESKQADALEIDSANDSTDTLSMTRREMMAGSAGVGFGLGALGMSAGRTRAETASQAGTSANVLAGHLQLEVKETDDGIHLQSLYDTLGERELLADQPGPLWRIIMYNPETDHTSGEREMLRADQGWQETQISRQSGTVELRWQGSQNDRFDGMSIVAQVTPDAPDSELRWNLQINNKSDWSVEQVAFPQAGLREMNDGELFYPTDEGKVVSNPWRGSKNGASYWSEKDGFDSITLEYMKSHCTLSYFSVYEPSETGLYFGLHDPEATHKAATAQTPSQAQGLRLRFRHPAPDMIVAGNDYELSGEGVWRLYEGDWYDAAQIYRDWATRQKWYPEPGSEGEEDTATWMREGVVWLILWGDLPVDRIVEFAEFMDVPVCVHWYAWYTAHHDDDYPDVFSSPKDGFDETVEELQEAGVRVMPYINTRLWDVDLDSFDTVGRQGASKAPSGEPYIADKPHADFAIMDSSSGIWQKEVKENALRLFNEYNVDAVYLDQVSNPAYVGADEPVGYPPRWRREFGEPTALCCDSEHNHPLGGGHWWTDSYREMLNGIREEMPNDGVITCESSPEPYADQLDGMLTWTWGETRGFAKGANPRNVPAFVAVYGGEVQMIVRGLGKTLRSTENIEQYGGKARQQMAMMLTYGNQLGWFKPAMLEVESMATYARRVSKLRSQLSHYFSGGRMRRPPELDVPTESAQWGDHGGYTKTMDTVLTSAWKQPDADRLVLPFVNWTDDAVTTTVEIDHRQYDVDGRVEVQKIGAEGPTGETFTTTHPLDREVTFEGSTAWAWEITPAE